MIAKFKILLFPALTTLFLFFAWLSGGTAFQIMLNGERTDGKIAALIRCYEEQCGLIADITQELTLTQADGKQITGSANRDGVQNAETYTEEQLAGLNSVKGGKADGIQRFLQREADKDPEQRIVTVLREETAKLLSGLTQPISADAYKTTDGADRIVTTILFTYIGGTDEEAELKTDIRREVSRTLNGEKIECESQDFILYEKDYRYTFRPIFAFETANGPVAALADTGARMSPRGNHHLGSAVKVAYMPEDPTQATILSDFGSLKEQKPLDALNSFFNFTFGQWFFPAVSLLLAFVYFGMSIITISLAVKPPKTENADTVDEEALAKMK